MIQITNKVASFIACQACSSGVELYKITVFNDERFSTSLHLCKRCCMQLKSLLSCVHLDDVKMVSFDELNVDKLN